MSTTPTNPETLLGNRPTGELTLVPKAERDYFPCAFCYAQFPTKAHRDTHEAGLCPLVDVAPPHRIIDLRRRYNIVLSRLPNNRWQAIDLVTFDDDPEARLHVIGTGESTTEAVSELLDKLAAAAAEGAYKPEGTMGQVNYT